MHEISCDITLRKVEMCGDKPHVFTRGEYPGDYLPQPDCCCLYSFNKTQSWRIQRNEIFKESV